MSIENSKILEAIKKHNQTRFKRLRDYYDGKHDILKRTFLDTTKPNNKVVTNLCKVVANSNINHLIGKPVNYSTSNKDDKGLKELQGIFDFNNEQTGNSQLAKYASIYSIAYELLYTKEDEDGIVLPAFKALDLRKQSVHVEKDDTVDENVLWAIRFYKDRKDESIVHVHYYDEMEVIDFELRGGELFETSRETHAFGGVPIIEYHNKEIDGFGDFEDVITLNDAYNILNSDDINESDYANDAYLIIKNMAVDGEELQRLKENRAILVDKDGGVEWLLKNMDPVWKNSIKDRLRKDIFAVAGTPDMSDEQFSGQASGEALKYKLLDFENNRVEKERYFTMGIKRRIELIFNFLDVKGKNFDWREISIQFTPNLPKQIKDEMEIAKGFTGLGIISKQTIRSLMSFIDDPAYEEELLKEEEEAYPVKLGVGDPWADEDDGDDDDDDKGDGDE